MEKINKGDFIELNYTGTVKDDNQVFDTTVKEVADANNLQSQQEYKPIIICVGEGFLLPALEDGLVGKADGKHTFDLNAEEGFGKKDAKLLKLLPMKVFKSQEIMPYPGLEVNIDNQYGVIRSVSGGRVIVDFNHPLSGKDLSYEIEVLKKVTDDKEKVESLLNVTGIHYNSASVKDGKAAIVLEHEVPKEYTDAIEEKIKKTVGVKSVTFIAKTKKDDSKKPAANNADKKSEKQ